MDVFAIVKTSLQPRAAITSRMIVEGDGQGNVRAAEWDRNAMKGQLPLEEAAEDKPSVIDLQKQRQSATI